MKDLVKLLRMNEDELKFNLFCKLIEKGYKPEYEDGYLYAKGEIPVMLVAHMDIVGKEPPKAIYYLEKYDTFYNAGGKTVLGGDDRCGVYAILKLLEKYKPYVLFTEDEEIGLIGAKKAAEKMEKPDVKYIIEIDRRGKDDCVFYQCGNEDFVKYVEDFGFKEAQGSCSDISVLGKTWDIASVNLSSGYYNEHTSEEMIAFDQLQNTIKRADKMLSKIKEAPYFDYKYKTYAYFTDSEFEEILNSIGKKYIFKNMNSFYEGIKNNYE